MNEANFPVKLGQVMVERYSHRFMCELVGDGNYLCGNCGRGLGKDPQVAQKCKCDARVCWVFREGNWSTTDTGNF